MKRMLTTFFAFIFCLNVFGWSGDGHRIIAQIAYDNLTPKAKLRIDKITFPEGARYRGGSRFIYISTWADRIRFQGDSRFDKWHYISLPISEYDAPTLPLNKKNAVFAIEKAKKVLANKNSSVKNKLFYLKILVHCVGDIHQPLHSVNRYTWQNLQGDSGGNGYMIYNFDNHLLSLHRYWDGGLGLFRQYNKRYPAHPVMRRKMAKWLERKYRNYLDGPEIERPTMAWANEGRYFARTFIYTVPTKTTPNREYVRHGREIVEQRLVLAGFRLANVLNHIFTG